MISQIAFVVLLVVAIGLAAYNARKIIGNIRLGRPLRRSDRPAERLRTMLLVAFGQKKMFKRPFAAILHLFMYVGFVIINVELLEILIDGVFGTHRVFAGMGGFFGFLIASFEWLALLVIAGCLVFLARRNIVRL